MNFCKTRISLKHKIVISIAVILIIFAVLLLSVVSDRNNEFLRHQKEVAEVVTSKLANEVQKIFIYKKKLMKAFLEDEKELLLKIVNDFDDDQLYDTLNKKIKRYFYDFFTSSIASDKGDLLKFSMGEIGDICVLDMKTYLETGEYKTRIHPNAYLYHYDILVSLILNGKKYLFISTFSSEEIVKLLHISSPMNHKLFIVNRDDKNLIEVTAKGSRDVLHKQGKLYLSDKEQKHILASKKIDGTFWHIVDSYDESSFEENRQRLIRNYSLIFAIFTIIIILLGRFVLFSMKKD